MRGVMEERSDLLTWWKNNFFFNGFFKFYG